MSFDNWWKENRDQVEKACGGWEFRDDEIMSRQAAEVAWNARQESNKTLRDIIKKSMFKSRVYRDAIKRMMTLGCRHTGRCASGKVNENYCPVCRPGMNTVYEFEPTSEELMKMLLAPECPECDGKGCSKCDDIGSVIDEA